MIQIMQPQTQPKSRGPRRVKIDYGRRDMYNFFIKNNPDLADITYAQYAEVCNLGNKGVSNLILREHFEFIIPGLGNLRIKKYLPKIKIDEEGNLNTNKLNVNWKATNDLWASDPDAKAKKIRVFHTNEHTEGYSYRWNFSNYRCACVNKTAYEFIPSRTNSRAINLTLRDPEFKGDFFL